MLARRGLRNTCPIPPHFARGRSQNARRESAALANRSGYSVNILIVEADSSSHAAAGPKLIYAIMSAHAEV
jgi:hypothetical protein